jgi:hypothetical protein
MKITRFITAGALFLVANAGVGAQRRERER